MQWLSVDDLRREHFHQVWQSNTSIPCAMGDIAKSVFATEVLKHPFLHACRIGFAGETRDVSIHAYGTLKGYMYETYCRSICLVFLAPYIVRFQKRPPPPHNPSGNSSLASYFPLKILAFEPPPPTPRNFQRPSMGWV